uniref:Bromodomain adjacent to zinc finger domain protein 1A n=1 Tax=Denticeps clupeoides TaxID=299321 RepID=A0AAY4A062_9TELE
MPLLHKKPFIRQNPPADLDPDEEVFLCKVTHEIFRTYDEFFERTILCNSLVWSCAVTGKAGLTYQEALESEKKARQSLESFPSALLLPLLHITALTQRTRLHEVSDDVYAYVKERFFPGEMVDVVGHSGARSYCQIMEVVPPQSNGTMNGDVKHHMEGDSIVISDSDDEITITSPPSRKKSQQNPSSFKYCVQPMKTHSCETLLVKANQMNRKKNVFTRDRLKLLLKQHCELQNGIIRLKASTVAHYHLSEQNFAQVFPDGPPVFAFSPPGKGRVRKPHDASPGQIDFADHQCMMRAAEEKLQLMQHKQEMMTMGNKSRLKKEKEDLWEAKKKEREDRERKKEEQKRLMKEEKERMKVEKEKEREKLREEKKKYAERLKLWNKPREDMECDDLQELPTPHPVNTRLAPELFGDALMVLEFLQAFGELFDLKDEFPEGISLEVLEEALVGCDPEGPLCELLFFFMSAIFQALAEEQEEVARDQVAEADAKDLTEALDDDSDPTQSAISAVAALAAAWPQLHQGCSLKQLDLDSCTLSEILRLHILASGADCSSTNAKFRYQKQGGFSTTDDPCVELRLSNPGLLKKLSSTAVYDLLPGEKLKILHALCGKLLTLVSTRDFIEDNADEQRQAKQELRELKAEQHRREREEAAERVRKRKEEKLKEQELKMKEKHEKLKEEEGRNGQHAAIYLCSPGKGSSPKDKPAEVREVLSPEEIQQQQQRERELIERIHKAAACTYILPLGRDRFYRRYWLFPSANALFVEDDYFGVTEDMLQPRPESLSASTENGIKEEVTIASVSGPPVLLPNRWAFYDTMQAVDELVSALNLRGHRESSLKDALVQEKERISQLLDGSAMQRYHYTDESAAESKVGLVKGKCASLSLGMSAPAERHMENRLRDLLLDIEDRIYQGTLGSVKVMDRNAWRAALEKSNYELLCPDNNSTQLNEDEEPMEVENRVSGKDRLQELKMEAVSTASTSASTPQPVSNTVHYLAQALAHIEQGIERKFLKAPLDGSEGGRPYRTIQERWRDSLLSSSSLSQVFLHLSTLERSVVWAKSILNARCKVCRRKGDAENMLLCDGCDRGHHIFCIRPKLKAVPSEDWFCPECRPKQRLHRINSRQRSSVDSDEDMRVNGSENEEEIEEEEEHESEEDSEEEIVPKKGAVKLPLASKGGRTTSRSTVKPSDSGHSTPRNPQQPSSGKGSTKGSGKKTTTPASNSKPPPRAGSRSSARLSQEILVTNGTSGKSTSQTSPSANQNESRKRPSAGTEVSPKAKVVLAPSTNASSSRRSSGRHQGVHELSACEQMTVELVRHEDSWPFKKLVSRTQVPDYYDIIKKPIALSTIREKVNNCEYNTALEYIEDVELMFSNCLEYNPRSTNEAKAGIRLQAFFHSELQSWACLTASPHPQNGPECEKQETRSHTHITVGMQSAHPHQNKGLTVLTSWWRNIFQKIVVM